MTDTDVSDVIRDVVEVERAGGIAVLRFSRPDNLNAISMALARGVAATLIELDCDDTVRGIVLTGAGDRAFCAGVDLHEARGMKVADIETWFGTACNVYHLTHINRGQNCLGVAISGNNDTNCVRMKLTHAA